MKPLLNILLLFLWFTGCSSGEVSHKKNKFKVVETSHATSEYRKTKIPYKLNKPDAVYELPFILNEISGLTDIDSTHVACVQDEIGTVFIYNFLKDSIVHLHSFDSVGDFEGLTYTEDAIYVLRSDGRLTEWSDFSPTTGGKKVTHYMLPLITANNEGLCFDRAYNRLLIAAKSKPMNHDLKSDRYIYEFNLSTMQLNPSPLYNMNTVELDAVAREFDIVQNEVTEKGKIKPFNFRPSSLAVHPITSDIYIISASDKLLVVMNRNGEFTYIEQLDPSIFAKAEGITFLNDGTMIITNEAADKSPTLLIFEAKDS